MSVPFFYALIGYCSGSILYSLLYCQLFETDGTQSIEKNPGVYNAFRYGGFGCGLFTLLGCFLKAYLPVYLYVHTMPLAFSNPFSALVIASPVLGHAFPVFYKFRGGQGLIPAFGAFCALLPLWQPAFILAVCALVFSAILVIEPLFYRTVFCIFFWMGLTLFTHPGLPILAAVLICSCAILLRILINSQPLPAMRFLPLWKH